MSDNIKRNKIVEGLKDAVAHARGEKPARYECGHWHLSIEEAFRCPASAQRYWAHRPGEPFGDA